MHSHAYSRDERCRGRALLERFAAADLAVVAIHAEPETKRIIPALFPHLSGRLQAVHVGISGERGRRTENGCHRDAIVAPADLKAAALKLAGGGASYNLGDSREEALANVSGKCLTSGPRTISSVG